MGACLAPTLGAQGTTASAPATDLAKLIGVSVAASGGPRDTLGLLVASVTRDGPADQAGLTTGSRILAVNGYLVRLAPAEIGQRAAADTALARFDRAIRTTPNGGSVALRVVGFGRTRTVTVTVPDARAVAVRSAAGDAAPAATPAVTVPPVAPQAAAPAPEVRATEVRATEVRATVATPAAATASTPVPMAADATSPRAGRSAQAVADLLGDAQLDLRRLARDTPSLAMSDSLAELEAQLGALRRRLRALSGEPLPAAVSPAAAPPPPQVAPAVVAATVPEPSMGATAPAPVVAPVVVPAQPAAAPAPAASSGTVAAVRIAVEGLELASVNAELAAYLGAQHAGALVVTRASDAWEPMRAGDVIVQVDGKAPDATGLRVALERRHQVSMQLLRRGRSFTVTFGEQQSP